MARKLRIEYPGAIYHVMSRGDHQEAIFKDAEDRQTFLKTFTEACEKTGWITHAYVLMGNHYHLLLETPEANLSAGMKWLQGTYTQRFNSRHKVYGHLFQGRYKALNVEDDGDYFQTVSDYIHLNPVRAGLAVAETGALKSFPWSSYPAYLAPPRKRPEWLETARVFASVGIAKDVASGRRRYETWTDMQVVQCGDDAEDRREEKWRKLRRGWYLGGETFKQRLLDWIEEKVAGPIEASDRQQRQSHDERAAERMIANGLKALKLTPKQLAKLPKGMPEKMILAWSLRSKTTVSRQWIADRLAMGHVTRVTAAVREVSSARRGELVKLRQLVVDD